MSGLPDIATAASAVRTVYEAKIAAELAAADRLYPGADHIACTGDPLAPVLVVKGMPGPAEAAGGSALSGLDGDALSKALASLGWSEGYFATLSRPVPAHSDEHIGLRLRAVVEAIDPRVVIALDADAAGDLAVALGIEALAAGEERRVMGRRIVYVSGFEASLGDESAKRTVWRELQMARPEGPAY